MKTDKMNFNTIGSYESPVLKLYKLCPEGLLCSSFVFENEDFDDIIPLFDKDL